MPLKPERLPDAYRQMLIIRKFEEAIRGMYQQGKIRGSFHPCVGQEATAVGGCWPLRQDDAMSCTYRGHGHALEKGLNPRAAMAEMLGKATGCCKGKGGSMHVADFSKGILGANGIVAGGPPISVGAALAARIRGNTNVAVSFSGDGSVNQGTCFEAMTMAVVLQAPAIFVIENNYYSEHTNISYAVGCDDLKARTEAFGFPVFVADGSDFFAVYEAAGKAIAHARAGHGPAGVFAEPAAAAAYAGFASYRRQGLRPDDSDNVVLLTGSGLKDTGSLRQMIKMPESVTPDVDNLEKAVR